MKKRGLSILLAAVLTFTAAPLNIFASDLDNHWSKDAFLNLEKLGIIQGYDDGSYAPDAKITRAEFFTIINRVTKVSGNSGSQFSDVSDKAWYKNGIDCAYTAKYASGYEDGTFRPETNIRRCEAAAAICKAFGGDVKEQSSFKDAIPEWAKLYVDMLVSAGLISGYEDNTFRANEYITRGETAAIFNKLAEIIITRTGDVTDSTYNGNVIITKEDITFRNCTFDKDIYISAGVNDGEVRFIGCTINGNVYIAGRNGTQTVFEDTDCKRAVVYSADESELVCTGSSKIDEAVIRSKTNIIEMNAEAGFGSVVLYAQSVMTGDFESVTVSDGEGLKLTDGNIEKLTVSAKTKPEIDVKGTIKNVEAKADFVLNGDDIKAGENKTNVKENDAPTNKKYSYSLYAMMNGTYEGLPESGGTREETVDKNYLLNGLTVTEGTLVPQFDPTVTSYTLVVPNNKGNVSIIPECDELMECKVKGETVGKSGYGVKDFADKTQLVTIDLIGGLVKRTSYDITVIGYGTDDTSIREVTADVPHKGEKTENGYKITLTGDIDYSNGAIPVNVSINTLNPDTKVKYNNQIITDVSVDLYNERVVTLNLEVVSEDATESRTYSIVIERAAIAAIDDPDETVLKRVISDPSSWTETDSRAMKLSSVNTEKLNKYKTYLSKISDKADGKTDKFELQAVVQRAVDVINKFDGKTIRLEAESLYPIDLQKFYDKDPGWYCVKATKDYEGSVGVLKAGALTVWASLFDFVLDDAPEGTFEMKICWYQKFNNSADIKVNDVKVSTVKPKIMEVNVGEVLSTEFDITTVPVTFTDGQNTVKLRNAGTNEAVNNTALDYVEFTFNF